MSVECVELQHVDGCWYVSRRRVARIGLWVRCDEKEHFSHRLVSCGARPTQCAPTPASRHSFCNRRGCGGGCAFYPHALAIEPQQNKNIKHMKTNYNQKVVGACAPKPTYRRARDNAIAAATRLLSLPPGGWPETRQAAMQLRDTLPTDMTMEAALAAARGTGCQIHPDRSEHHILRMRPDGSMEGFSNATDAWKAYKSAP